MSVKQFSKTLAIAGKFSKISKLDLVDAYKNVSCQISKLRLQRFSMALKILCRDPAHFWSKISSSKFR
jgi:hypothetical protein